MQKCRFLYTELLALLIIMFLMGCRTIPLLRDSPDPIRFLDPEADFFSAIPCKGNEDLIGSIIKQQEIEISNENLTKFTQYVETVYFCYIKKTNKFECLFTGNFPALIEIIFTKENNWTKLKKVNNNKEYYIHTEGIELAILDNSMIAVTNNSMLSIFERIESLSDSIINSSTNTLCEVFRKINEVENITGSMLFYIQNQAVFMPSVKNISFNFGLKSAYGYCNKSFNVNSEVPFYNLKITFLLKDQKVEKTAQVFLKTLFALLQQKDYTIKLLEDGAILCDGITISADKLISLIIGG